MKTDPSIQELLKRFNLISDQVSKDEIKIILEQLQVIHDQKIEGAVVELGCYLGTTSLFISRYLKARSSTKQYHVYDSFAGLPEKDVSDQSVAGDQFKAGELKASKAAFITHFKKAGLPLPVIHKGWFSDLKESDLPPVIALAFLDGDFYDSIADSLRLVWPKLSRGAVVLVDDYQNEALPGAARAVNEWLRNHSYISLQTTKSLVIIKV
ncbi:hypothetical protein CYG49_00200 [Candidatus Saccharibacteria bacterium]|nr:MAG: hypothetical protein CYG49_00200 [Candidatus Saccharibacteria bacterium]